VFVAETELRDGAPKKAEDDGEVKDGGKRWEKCGRVKRE
jgi:hypothetical protein